MGWGDPAGGERPAQRGQQQSHSGKEHVQWHGAHLAAGSACMSPRMLPSGSFT
jgi:hypothetical protein